MRAGLGTLGDVPARIGWRSVQSFARHSPRGSAFFNQVTGPEGQWSDETHALVTLIDTLNEYIWLWQCSKIDPKKRSMPPQPTRILRPGQVPPEETDKEKLTGAPLPKADWAEYWRTGVRPSRPGDN
jgi:hypothetical protein